MQTSMQQLRKVDHTRHVFGAVSDRLERLRAL